MQEFRHSVEDYFPSIKRPIKRNQLISIGGVSRSHVFPTQVIGFCWGASARSSLAPLLLAWAGKAVHRPWRSTTWLLIYRTAINLTLGSSPSSSSATRRRRKVVVKQIRAAVTGRPASAGAGFCQGRKDLHSILFCFLFNGWNLLPNDFSIFLVFSFTVLPFLNRTEASTLVVEKVSGSWSNRDYG